MKISKSQYIRGLQCHKSLWLLKHKKDLLDKPDQATESLFKTGHQVGEMAKQLFPNGTEIEFNGADFKGMLNRTAELIAQGTKIIYEASFSHNGIFVMADILVKNNEQWDVYEVKASTSVKEYHRNDLSIQWHVISQFIPLGQAYLVHINNQYTRNGALDVQQLLHQKNITQHVIDKQNNIQPTLDTLATMLANTEPNIDIGGHCHNPFTCDFYSHCWKAIPTQSVFNLYRMSFDKKLDLYQQGIIKYDDIPIDVELTKIQQTQVESCLKESTFIDTDIINQFIQTVEYPINFFDFETFQNAIPRFDGQRPYQQMPFQYSLHIMHKDDTLEHKEFLGDEHSDPRELLIQHMLRDISPTGSIMAYNQGFEKGRIRELATHYSKYAEQLLSLNKRFVDLLVPFRNLGYYHPNFNGSFSIKSVLPTLFPNNQELDYKSLDIQNGGMAMDTFANLHLLKDSKQRDKIRNDLLAYCHLDTLAMVRIWEKLISTCNNTLLKKGKIMKDKDANFVYQLMNEFFEQKHIVKRLKFFNVYEDIEDRIKGWEIWWQIEFAYFIDQHKNVTDWYREAAYVIDKRTTVSKEKVFIDFKISNNTCGDGEYIGLELKQSYNFHKCINKMLDDYKKISSIKVKDDDIRSIWNIGIFLKDISEKESPEEIILKKAAEKNLDLDESSISIDTLIIKKGNNGLSFKMITF